MPEIFQRTTAVLCPNCRKLVSTDESRCPYCGLSSPGAAWKRSFLTQRLNSPERLIQSLIIVNAIMYLIALMMSRSGFHFSTNPLSFLSPDNQALILLGGTGTFPIDRFHRWWTLISASYLHGGILHIVFNMLTLQQIAPVVIREYGPYRMFIIYTVGGAGGFLASYLADVPLTIGASAAICGLIGAALYYGKHRGGTYGQAIYRQVGGWALGIIALGLLVPRINNWGHGGGMATGLAMGIILGYQEQKKETLSHRLFAGILMAGTVLILIWAVFTALFYRL